MKFLLRYAACWGFMWVVANFTDPAMGTDAYFGLSLMAGVLFVLWQLFAGKTVSQAVNSALDTPLFHWTKKDPFSIRELLKSVAIFGATGSGKSSGSGLLLARAITRLRNSGGLILVSKPEDKDFWVKRFEEAGRMNDLIIFGPNEPARCNFIDFEMKQGGDSRSLTEFLLVTGEALSKGVKGGENAMFWEQGKKRLLYNSIEPIRQAYGKITIPAIQEFITTAAYAVETIKNEESLAGWKSKLHYKTMDAAARKEKSGIEASDFELIGKYWTTEFINMDNKVRSSIIADVMNILHTYNMGIAREMVSTQSIVTPEVMAQGKWVLVNFPLDQFGESGKIIMAGWKYLTQKYILRRHVKEGDSVICIHADEAQEMMSSFDASFLAKSRSHLGMMIYLTQSIHSYFGEIKEGEHKAKAFLTNFGTQIFHTLGDAKSAEYASSLLGNRRELFVSTSAPKRTGIGEMIFGEEPIGASMSESYQNVLQPAVFLSGLRSGGKDKIVDGIVIKNGTPFSSGENWLHVEFRQDG